MPKKDGFTLVELLVVITIIAILSIAGIASFTNIQSKSRDARRREDVQAIQKTLEAHYGDTGCTGVTVALPYCAVNSTNASRLFSNGSLPVYPSNPSSSGTTNYSGLPAAAVAAYTICARLESSTGNYTDAGTTASADNTGLYFCLSNQQ